MVIGWCLGGRPVDGGDSENSKRRIRETRDGERRGDQILGEAEQRRFGEDSVAERPKK